MVMRANTNVLEEPVVVSNSTVDLSARIETNIGVDLDVGTDPVLVIESIVDVSFKMETKIGAKPNVVTAKSVPVVDAVFYLMVKMNYIVYLSISFVFR